MKDSISWKWEKSGEYSATLAYKIQFQGSYPPFKIGQLWKAKVEQKVKMFGWTALHHKIPTADLLTARGCSPSPLCSLCSSCPKDVCHLLTDCIFTMGVLHHIWTWFHFRGSPPTDSQDLAAWINSATAAGGASHLR
jgi:hypothetical protein